MARSRWELYLYHSEDNAWRYTFIPPRLNIQFYLNLTNIRRKTTIQTETCWFSKFILCSFRDLITLLFANCWESILHWDTIDFFFISNRLTPWSRVPLQKLTGRQLVKKFPAFYGTRKFITAFTSARHLPLSRARAIQSMSPHPTS
jgi:hypothetical protein